MKTIKMLKEIWGIFAKYDFFNTIIFLVVLLVFSIISFLQPIISGKIILILQSPRSIIVPLLLFVINLLIPIITKNISGFIGEMLSGIVKTEMQREIYHRLVLSDSLYYEKSKGEILTSIHTDTSTIINLGKLIISFSSNIISSFVAAFGLMLYSPIVFLFSIIIAVIIYFINFKLNVKIGDFSKEKFELKSRYKNTVNDIVFSYEETKFLNSFSSIMKKLNKQQNDIKTNEIHYDVRIDSPGRILDLIVGITPLIGYIIGIYLFESNYEQLSFIVTVTSYMVNFWSKISFLSFLKVLSPPLIDSLDRIKYFTNSNLKKSCSKESNIQKIDQIVIKNVSFSYNHDHYLFRNISWQLSNRGIVCISGISGSGKSTFIKLLLKEYEPTEGTIEVNGTPLTLISEESWREKIGYMAQSGSLFSGTIKENIELYNPLFDAAFIRNLAEKLNIVQELGENFLNIHIMEDNVGISGGQKDRIRLLCALSKKPLILILDEPTSSIDRTGVQNIVDLLLYLKNKMLIICSTHDEVILNHCDCRICVDQKEV